MYLQGLFWTKHGESQSISKGKTIFQDHSPICTSHCTYWLPYFVFLNLSLLYWACSCSKVPTPSIISFSVLYVSLGSSMMNVEYSSSSGPSYTDLLPQASGEKKNQSTGVGIRQRKKQDKQTKNIQSGVHTVSWFAYVWPPQNCGWHQQKFPALFTGLLGGCSSLFPSPPLIQKGQQAWQLLLAWWEAALCCTGDALISNATICTPCMHSGNSYTALPLPVCCRAALHSQVFTCWDKFHPQAASTGWTWKHYRLNVLPHYP